MRKKRQFLPEKHATPITAEQVASSKGVTNGLGLGLDKKSGQIGIFFIRNGAVLVNECLTEEEAEGLGKGLLDMVSQLRGVTS